MGDDMTEAGIITIAGDRLSSYITRLERLAEEKRALAEDMKEVFAEAKATGFDPKIMRKILKERATDADELAEENAVLDVYRGALGMLLDTPLGKAAVDAVKGQRRKKGADGDEARP
jgi:uncharacterized protein (UPF0335 family)